MKRVMPYIAVAVLPFFLWIFSKNIYSGWVMNGNRGYEKNNRVPVLIALNDRLEEILNAKLSDIERERRVLLEKINSEQGSQDDKKDDLIRLKELQTLEISLQNEISEALEIKSEISTGAGKERVLNNRGRVEMLEQKNITLEQEKIRLEEELSQVTEEVDSLKRTVITEEENNRRLDQARETAVKENESLSYAVARLNRNRKNLEDELEKINRQREIVQRQIIRTSSANEALFLSSGINGIFHPLNDTLVLSVNPDSAGELIDTGSFDVYEPGRSNRIKTRIQLFIDGGVLNYRVYPGQPEPEGGDWF